MIYRLPGLLLLCGLLVALSAPVHSQAPVKRPITHDDYNKFGSMQSPALSPDGNWVAYALSPADGDGTFVVRNVVTGKEYRHSRGARPTTVEKGEGGETPPPAAKGVPGAKGKLGPAGGGFGGGQHQFSPDGKLVLFTILPSRDRSKGKGAVGGGGGSTLAIMNLADGKVSTIERVSGYTMPEDGTPLLVYRRGTGAVAVPDATKGGGAGGKGGGKGKGGFGGKGGTKGEVEGPPRPPVGGDLILRDLNTGKERTLNNVTEYSLTRDGKLLVYAVAGKAEDGHGVYAMAPTSEGPPMVIRAGLGRYSRLAWDEKQTQLVFFQSKTPTGAPAGAPIELRICHWKRPAAATASAFLFPTSTSALTGLSLVALQTTTLEVTELDPAGKPGLRPNVRVNDTAGLSFSSDGSRLYYTVNAIPPALPKAADKGEEKTATTPPAAEKANVELWHYKDDFIFPLQKARYNPRPTYRAVFHLEDKSVRQLTDETMAQLQTSEGDWAIGVDDRAYRILVGSTETGAPGDHYLVNTRTGEKKLLAKKQSSVPSFSPKGKYLLNFDGKNWHTLSLADGKRVNLTEKLPVSFVSESHDLPAAAPSYGVAGWTDGDTHVLLYDRYDVWMIAADGSSAKNVTAGLGRKNSTQMRIVRLDARERGFDPNKPILFRAEGEWTRDTGFYRGSLSGETPKLLIMGARNYGTPTKARKGDRLMFTISTFYDYPDVYTSDMDFREIQRVTHGNPKKDEFNWGKAELIKYKSADGVPLTGVLVKPENFDPHKQYPMIVYIYERLSQNMHRFVEPRAGTSINPTYYASNGYLVLMPDIAYTVGYPGQSAVKCVLPAIQAVVDQGCVDEKAIGIQGHSWGGYQTAYLITQTTRFKAAAAGAPVANMTSAYGGIRWGSGLPRQFQYEKTQSRIGGSLWEYPTRFIENSPLFYADKIKTPLMMLHNDRDDAVPWYQGIEYYLALRRLGKEVYLFNYPGELHGLRSPANTRDYTIRMQQFFDHHLKGAAKPEWMAKGEPYTGSGAAGRGGARPGGATTPPTEPGTSEPE